MVPRWLGWVWLSAGVIGVAGAVAVASFGVAFVESSTRAAVDALDATRALMDTVGDTAEAVDVTVGSVVEGLATLEGSVADGAATLSGVSRLADDLGRMATVTIPESLDALRDTMPQLIGTAGVIDGVMRTLSFVGANYDPDAPLDDSLRELDLRLAAIPEQLRSQAANFDDAAQGIADFGSASVGIASDIGDIQQNLDESRQVLTGYSERVDDALAVLDGIEQQLESQATAAKVIAIILGVVLAVGQTVPIAAGWWVLWGRPTEIEPIQA
jgi:methyl-accepting chemotaxis protein